MATPGGLEAGQVLPQYRVRAHNGSTRSDNKIHDDAVARQYGFAGGLVPGVTVYAYMTHPVVEALGERFVEHGRLSARFLKPFYEGDEVTVSASITRAGGGGAELDLRAVNAAGELCAVGTASLGEAADEMTRAGDFPEAPLPSPKRPATPEALADVTVLGSLREKWDGGEATAKYLAEVADDLPLYRGPAAVAHPGYLIRKANSILAENVALGPWIHVSSDVRYLGLVRHGQELSTRGRITGLFERKGHRFVELDVLVVADDSRPIMRATHVAIYDVRKAQ